MDKMCVFCLYPIPDSQQCLKRVAVDAPFCPGYLIHPDVSLGPTSDCITFQVAMIEFCSFELIVLLLKYSSCLTISHI